MPEPAEPPVRSEEDRRAAFEELMRAERTVATVLVSTGRTWWQQQPTPPVSGLDLKMGDCFDAPDASGEFDVFTVTCAEHHDGEVFAVVALPYDEYPGVVEVYDDALPRCAAQASTNYAAVASSGDVRVQVMTHTPETWKTRPHRVVCYFHLADERNGPLLG